MSHLKAIATPGAQERALSALFRNPGPPEQVSDQPLVLVGAARPEEGRVIARLLEQTGQISGFGEELSADIAKASGPHESLAAYLAQQVQAACPDGQGLGLLVDVETLSMALRMNLPAYFAGARLVHVTREDPVAQALSASGKGTSRGVEAALDTLAAADTRLRLIARVASLPRLEVSLEAGVADPATTLSRLAPFCGFPDADVTVPALVMPAPLMAEPEASAFHADISAALAPKHKG